MVFFFFFLPMAFTFINIKVTSFSSPGKERYDMKSVMTSYMNDALLHITFFLPNFFTRKADLELLFYKRRNMPTFWSFPIVQWTAIHHSSASSEGAAAQSVPQQVNSIAQAYVKAEFLSLSIDTFKKIIWSCKQFFCSLSSEE